jgi:hypothetical protein
MAFVAKFALNPRLKKAGVFVDPAGNKKPDLTKKLIGLLVRAVNL